MPFEIKWEKRALKELKKIPTALARQMVLKVRELTENPINHSYPLSDCDYRKVRAGDYRAIIEVIHDKKRVSVLLIGHRKNVYKRLF